MKIGGHKAALLVGAGALAVTMAAAVGPASGAEDGPVWDYAENGPTTWADNFPTCGGDIQTPIDVQEITAGTDLGGVELVIDYDRLADVTVFNNTHTVQANVEAGAGEIRVMSDGETKTYKLLQFHFHTPSEHELSGYDEDAEMHLVHQADDGSLAVVGVLLDQGQRQVALNRVWRDLPGVDDEREIAVRDVPIRGLVPDTSEVYHYIGSLTTPPCTENVSWFVMGKVDTLSPRQMHEMREIFSGEEFPSGNARPIQRIVVDDLVTADLDRK